MHVSICSYIVDIKEILQNYLSYMDDVAQSKKNNCDLTTTDNESQKSFVFRKTYLLRTPATIHFTICV